MARRGRRELQVGVERLENLWDNMVEKHLSESLCVGEESLCIVFVSFSDNPTPRSPTGLVLGAVPHIAILFFTVLVVWTAQPSSS